MDLGLNDRVYVVTGGSRGLGRATAQALVADGARVVLSARNADTLAETVAALGSDHAVAVVADNADPDTPDRLIAAARDRFGRLDGALISVGGPPAGQLTAIGDDQWRSAFDSVFLGTVRLLRTFADALDEGGTLAVVLSVSVRNPVSGLSTSNGLRPGLGMLVKDLADTLGPRGVRVVGLMPGRIATERMQELARAAGRTPAEEEALQSATIPLRRYGRPNEFGAVAAFVLSPASSYLTGSMIAVDGGAIRAL